MITDHHTPTVHRPLPTAHHRPPPTAGHRLPAGGVLQSTRLQVVDLLIIAGYLVAVVAAGAWFGRKQDTTNRYFFAGQTVPWWAIAASIVATETSTITFISVPGLAFARGGNFTFLQLVFGYPC